MKKQGHIYDTDYLYDNKE